MSDTRKYFISTEDNPYSYFTQFDEWYQWDTSKGYNTLSLLDRVTRTSDELSPQLQLEAIKDAIDEIVSENVSGVHIKVFDPSDD